ncbi:hypothetical protein PCIT_a0668 [Pseudoalteromonas citrea]|uniref:Uncharacterized protein n=1 Tax=Pseudoalteromonas citrea TaxID=43655 RepID=A0AAD4AKZ8_9GAMM|nr:hypothetical protein PCIT_a0668 [Pseudoalteromonas citrea]
MSSSKVKPRVLVITHPRRDKNFHTLVLFIMTLFFVQIQSLCLLTVLGLTKIDTLPMEN